MIVKIGENEYDDDQLLRLHNKLLDFAESYIKSWKLHAKGPSPEFTKSVVNTQRLASDPEIKAAIAARKKRV